jgi:hypothetical protein
VPEVLTGPFAVAAIVVAVAGAAKLRSPRVAAGALRELGLPAEPAIARAVGACELGLGLWCVVAPGVAAAALLGGCYVGFAVVSLALARRRASCGCFGGGEASAWGGQSLISAVLAMICALAAIWAPHGAGWMLGRSAGEAVVLVLGIAGAAYATVVAYTQLPAAWGAWSAR